MNIGYIRASTDDQELTPKVQRAQMIEAARREGAEIDVWAEDPAVTSKIRFDKRPGGSEVIRLARKGDTVWFAKIDRGFRSLSDFVLTLDKWERIGIGIRLVDLPGQFDISTPQGKAFIQVFAIFAELERKMISVRTREALAFAKKKNQAVGKYAGYGFKWELTTARSKAGKRVKIRVPDPDERAVMGQIVVWHLTGHDFEHIMSHLRTQGIKTTEGKMWSVDRVKRAYLAELKLQQAENPKEPVRS